MSKQFGVGDYLGENVLSEKGGGFLRILMFKGEQEKILKILKK